MNLKNINAEASQCIADQNNRIGWYSVLNDFNVDDILTKYGPEGCFILSDALREAAQNDMDMAVREAVKDIADGEMLIDANTRFIIGERRLV